MINDAAWLQAMGKTVRRIAEQPSRRADNDLYSALCYLGLLCQEMAIAVEDQDALLAEEPTTPGRDHTRPGVIAPTRKTGT